MKKNITPEQLQKLKETQDAYKEFWDARKGLGEKTVLVVKEEEVTTPDNKTERIVTIYDKTSDRVIDLKFKEPTSGLPAHPSWPQEMAEFYGKNRMRAIDSPVAIDLASGSPDPVVRKGTSGNPFAAYFANSSTIPVVAGKRGLHRQGF